MNDEVRQSMTSASTWTRGLYMLLFALIYSIAEFVVVFICIFQFIFSLAKGEINDRLLSFSTEICEFMLQILQYETFNTEYKPFPFNPWPEIDKAEMNADNNATSEEASNQGDDIIEGEVISPTDPKEDQ